MHRNNDVEQQIVKVGVVMAITTILTSPLLLLTNKKLGILMMLAIDAVVLNQLYGFGKSKRPIQHFANNLHPSIAAYTGDANNTLSNVNKGIDTIVGNIADTISRLRR